MLRISSILLLLFSYHCLACGKPVDPQKVVLFINLNDAPKEIAIAHDAACKRGETLFIIEVSEEDKKRSRILEEHQKSNRKKKIACGNLKDFEAQAICLEKINPIIEETTKKILKYTLTGESLIKAIEPLKARNASVSSLVLSGHHGPGGEYEGSFGSVDNEEISAFINSAPELFQDTKSLHLLGCYTTVIKELVFWEKLFPNAYLISGFDEKGPLKDNPNGLKYFKQILESEQKLCNEADQNKLQELVSKDLTEFRSLSAAIYFSPGNQCEQFYLGSETNKKVSPLDIHGCEAYNSEIEKIYATYSPYAEGRLPIPKDTGRSPLREIYTKMMKYAHCTQLEGASVHNLEPDQIFGLIFFHEFKQSFYHYFEKDWDKLRKFLVRSPKTPERTTLLEALPDRNSIKTFEKSHFRKLHDAFKNFKTAQKEDADLVSTLHKATFNMMLNNRCLPLAWHKFNPNKPSSAKPTCHPGIAFWGE